MDMIKQKIQGYKMLKLLSMQSDCLTDAANSIVRDYIQPSHLTQEQLQQIDHEIECTNPADTIELFDRAAEQFYLHSDKNSRKAFILVAIQVVRADDKLNLSENQMISRLFIAWLS
jgi:uncharacterized tellurite resistance protein B-like protein